VTRALAGVLIDHAADVGGRVRRKRQRSRERDRATDAAEAPGPRERDDGLRTGLAEDRERRPANARVTSGRWSG